MLRVLPLLLAFALGIYAFIDCLTTPEDKVRSLPKLAWVFILLIFSLSIVAPVGWLVAGRPRRESAGGRGRTLAPDDDPEFLASLDKLKPPPAAPRPPAAGGSSAPSGSSPAAPGSPEEAEMLRRWEEDLRRREDRLRDDADGPDGTERR